MRIQVSQEQSCHPLCAELSISVWTVGVNISYTKSLKFLCCGNAVLVVWWGLDTRTTGLEFRKDHFGREKNWTANCTDVSSRTSGFPGTNWHTGLLVAFVSRSNTKAIPSTIKAIKLIYCSCERDGTCLVEMLWKYVWRVQICNLWFADT